MKAIQFKAFGKLEVLSLVDVSREFQLGEAVEAQRLLESGHVRGKLVFSLG